MRLAAPASGRQKNGTNMSRHHDSFNISDDSEKSLTDKNDSDSTSGDDDEEQLSLLVAKVL